MATYKDRKSSRESTIKRRWNEPKAVEKRCKEKVFDSSTGEFTGIRRPKDVDGDFFKYPRELKLIKRHLDTKAEILVLETIWEKLVAWKKERDAIAFSQFETETGLTRGAILEAIESLELKGIIEVDREGRIFVYSFKYVSFGSSEA